MAEIRKGKSVIHRTKILALLLFLTLPACTNEFERGQRSEKLGRYASAIADYEVFLKKNPKDPRAAEALYRIGEIYRGVIGDYSTARTCFEKVIQQHKGTPWPDAAKFSLMNCPDYFPFDPHLKRDLGDVESSGQYMRIVEKYRSAKEPNRIKMKKQIFSGAQLVSSVDLVYEKKDNELREYLFSNPDYTVILRYPPKKNLRWETLRDGKRIEFIIEDDQAALDTKAGVFTGCLKVREQPMESKSTWKVHYYCPKTGLVLSGVATEKSETKIFQLLSSSSEKKESEAEGKQGRLSAWLQRVKSWFKKGEKNEG